MSENEQSEKLTGRDLDAAVAERVMGWRTSTISDNVWYSEAEHNSFHKDKFHPSESIEAAMRVVEKMREKDWFIEVANTSTKWFVNFIYDINERRDAVAESESLTEAICLAALDAVQQND